MKTLKKTLFILLICLCCANFTVAQEVLSGLRCNPVLKSQNKPLRTKNANAIYLPFFDDFSNYVGYPKLSLWADNQAFINNTFAIYPPTLGVATLDALDENGAVYSHAETTPFGADTLTSLPIRMDSIFSPRRALSPADSVYFSFYYQPGGGSKKYPAVEWERIGNRPETSDLLVLEFGYPTGNQVFAGYEYCDYEVQETHLAGDTIVNPYFLPDTVYYIFTEYTVEGESIMIPCDSLFKPEYRWNHIWSSRGCKLDDWLDADTATHLTYFKRVMIPVTDPQYFRKDFQFRFRNFASLEPDGYEGWASNVDQWNIDYVSLDYFRTCNDPYPDDVAFVSPTTSALKEYQSMPWNQYRSSDMKDKFKNEIANISDVVKNTSYGYMVTTETGAVLAEYPENNYNASPYYPTGLHTYTYHAEPDIDFVFPSDGRDSALFNITHVFQVVGGVGDDCSANDTCIFQQKFYNYYAYDDGTAEAGYSLISGMTNPASFLAIRFTLAQPDTLRGVRMWFNGVYDDANIEPFTLMVWNDAGGLPGDVLLSVPSRYPGHAENVLDFVNYYFDEPLPISGTFYVGTYQDHDVPLNIGFDQNNDARAHWVYKTTDEWREPFFLGAPMVRPVLGKYFNTSAVKEIETLNFSVYPNPASQQITIHLEGGVPQMGEVSIWDVTGRKVAEYNLTDNESVINISNLNAGMYVLQLRCNGQMAVKKIIKL